MSEGGAVEVSTILLAQSVDAYVEVFHARNGFSRRRMDRAQANQFDCEVKSLLAEFGIEDRVDLEISGELLWVRPLVK